MLVVLPVVLLVVFGYAAGFTITTVTAATVGPGAAAAAEVLPPPFDVVRTDPAGTTDDARNLVRDTEVDVAVDTSTQPPVAYVDGSNLFAAQTASAALAPARSTITTTVLFNPELRTSWVMVPALIGLILAFIGTVVTSLGLVRERAAGTLEQLAVMPFRPSDVIVGKIAPYFLLAALDLVIVTTLGCVIFDVPFNGSIPTFALGGALFLFVVLGIGVLISTMSQTQGQAIQVAILVLLPQVLLSGMIFPLQAIVPAIRWISYLLPLTWFVQVSQGVMLRGAPLATVAIPLLVLAAMAVVVFSAAVLRFRRDLAPRIRS
jgi:ABC-2 type transport system permease protein